MHSRENLLNNWLKRTLADKAYVVSPLTGDASFRRYYRLTYDNGLSQIVMDAPPIKETLDPFINIAKLLLDQGLTTPRIEAMDKDNGFLLLEDFGDHLLLSMLNEENANSLYSLAINKLILLQQSPMNHLPCFDQAFVLTELQIFKEWFLHRYLNIELTSKEQSMIEESMHWLSVQVAALPSVLIHRDYHSRNLMLLDTQPDDLGIIDFQDAMQGPYTYDLVSLLKDCYVQWPQYRVRDWARYYYEQSLLAQKNAFSDFYRDFELCGLQRHLKVLGVFSRLYLRDNKANYLKDLPLTLHYTLATLESCHELKPLFQFMQQRVQLP